MRRTGTGRKSEQSPVRSVAHGNQEEKMRDDFAAPYTQCAMLLALMEVAALPIYLHVIATNVRVCLHTQHWSARDEEIAPLPRLPTTGTGQQASGVFASKQIERSTFFHKVIREENNYRILPRHFLLRENKYVQENNSNNYAVLNAMRRGKEV